MDRINRVCTKLLKVSYLNEENLGKSLKKLGQSQKLFSVSSVFWEICYSYFDTSKNQGKDVFGREFSTAGKKCTYMRFYLTSYKN